MPDDATLTPTASDPEFAGSDQPVEEAVSDVTENPVVSDGEVDPAQAATSTPAESKRKWADKYDAPEELEKGYLHTTAEATRLAQENAWLKQLMERGQAPKQAEPATPSKTWTEPELETLRGARSLELSEYQAQKILAQQNQDFEAARRFEKAAQETANQLNLIDKELRKLDRSQYETANRRQSAEQKLVSTARKVLEAHKADIVPGTPLYEKASEYHNDLLAMGYPDSPMIQAHAITLAVQELGISKAAPQQAMQTRKDLVTSINQSLKAGIVEGAGKGTSTASAVPDFMKMTDEQFANYKRQRGWE